MQFKDYYATMGVAREASADEIKQAYRKLARKYHPDVSKEAGAEQRFKEVGEAYEVLRDPQKRAAYDQLGSGPAPGESFQPPPDWGAGFGFGDGGASAGHAGGGGFAFDGDPSEFFETLFGRAGFAGAQRHASGSHRTTGQGPDHHARVVIDLDASLEGGTRSLTLRIPDTADGARTRLRERTLNVKIPRGILAGQHIRLAGQGQALPGGGAGDLYLEVAFAPHPLYQPDGRDLHIDLPVAPWEAALGATVAVPTPGTRVELKIPPASKTGTRLRLRARGLPATPPGDLYVTLQVVLPPADTEPMRQAYRQLQTASAGFDPRATRGESA